jgi:molybdate transport system ATP-binding protein
MHDGRLVQHGPTAEVFSKPASADVADILAVETMVEGTVVSVRDGIAMVKVGGATLHPLAGELPDAATQVFACIRAEDVSLSTPGGPAASPRNRLPAIVKACLCEGPLVRVELDCGFPLVAMLTPQGCEELALAPGSRVIAEIKAPKIHLIAR